VPVLLDPADVHIWYRDTGSIDDDSIDEAAPSGAASLLSADERARHDRFVFARDRRDFAEAHALTRRVLSFYEDVPPGDWMFEVTAEGKPFLPPGRTGSPPLHFNLSHTHGLVACAVARGAGVGLDVELIDRAVDDRGISRRYFTQAEDAFIHACPEGERPARFIELWTLKEAYIKAIGSGLTHPLDDFGFAFEDEHSIRFDAPPGTSADEWMFALFAPIPRARMAVAVPCGGAARCRIIARADGGAETKAFRQSPSQR
jgi:4'-phosphopantetheinyl transferase